MGVCYIVGAGECPKLDFNKKDGDFVIAADGGCAYLERQGIMPDLIIGDFDSLESAPSGDNVIRLNPVKDITDMDAAVQEGVKRGYSEFCLYGACGGRIDHTLANIQLVASLAQNKKRAYIRNGAQVITAVCNGSLCFDSSYKGYVSVFAHSDKCEGICLKGLKYPLENAVLRNSFPLGVSNEFLGVESEIIIGKGTAVIVYSLPEACI